MESDHLIDVFDVDFKVIYVFVDFQFISKLFDLRLFNYAKSKNSYITFELGRKLQFSNLLIYIKSDHGNNFMRLSFSITLFEQSLFLLLSFLIYFF